MRIDAADEWVPGDVALVAAGYLRRDELEPLRAAAAARDVAARRRLLGAMQRLGRWINAWNAREGEPRVLVIRDRRGLRVELHTLRVALRRAGETETATAARPEAATVSPSRGQAARAMCPEPALLDAITRPARRAPQRRPAR